MSIVFSEHAARQIQRRKISKNKIIETIKNYDEITTSFRGRKLRCKRFNDKLLEVITKSEGSKITIITAYYLKGK